MFRVLACGTLFVTTTLDIPSLPAHDGETTRAKQVRRTTSGSSPLILSLLAQFPRVRPSLLAPLGGDPEAKSLRAQLERDGVSTRLCPVNANSGVPSAWILRAEGDGGTASVLHNPLPEITHEDFISRLGPVLAPENYGADPEVVDVHSPPFEWMHFEGRSARTTLANLVGLDGLARERRWRHRCIFSLQIRGRQGVEALIPHVDVVFFSQAYALAQSSASATPRQFLLSMAARAPSHALLVVHWGAGGAALLSIPTREYFQASAWTPSSDPSATSSSSSHTPQTSHNSNITSVRTGSGFYAIGVSRKSPDHESDTETEETSRRMPLTQTPAVKISAPSEPDPPLDEAAAQDAFVAGMIYALSRRIAPGPPYTPAAVDSPAAVEQRGAWRLEECLRFASELSGRKVYRLGWEGLADQMGASGWTDQVDDN